MTCQTCGKPIHRNGRGENVHDDYMEHANDHHAIPSEDRSPVRVTYTVTVDIDRQVWADSYGLTLDEVGADVAGYMRTAIRTLVADHLSAAGDVGHVSVTD